MELLVVVAIIGLLVGLLLPAVQAAREAARRSSCSNSIRQLALGVLTHESAERRFPAGYRSGFVPDPNNTGWCVSPARNHGMPWTVAVLPQLEQLPLHSRFILTGTFPSTSNFLPSLVTPANRDAWATPLPLMRCPSDPGSGSGDNGTNYFGVQGGGPESAASCRNSGRVLFVNGILHHNSRVKAAHVVDGLSKTLLVGETKYQPRAPHLDGLTYAGWASSLRSDTSFNPNVLAAAVLSINSVPGSGGEPARSPGVGMFSFMSKVFGSFHPGGAIFAFGDGSVRFLEEWMDLTAYQSLGAMNDGVLP